MVGVLSVPVSSRRSRSCASGVAASSSSPRSAAPTTGDEAAARTVMCGPTSRRPRRDLAGERAVGRLQEPAAEDDLHRLLRQVEAGERRPGESDDLVGKARDDRRGNGVVGSLGEDEPRQLDHPAPRDLLLWIASASSSGLERPKWAGTERSRLVLGPRPSSLRAARRDRRHADVIAAAPVACDLAERGEADLAAVGRDADAVDPGAADDGDAPAALGAGAQNGERVVADGTGSAQPRSLTTACSASSSAGKSTPAMRSDADLGDGPARASSPPAHRLVEEPLEHVEAPREPEVVRRAERRRGRARARARRGRRARGPSWSCRRRRRERSATSCQRLVPDRGSRSASAASRLSTSSSFSGCCRSADARAALCALSPGRR